MSTLLDMRPLALSSVAMATALAVAIPLASASAQVTTSAISGIVTDRQHRAVEHARVRIVHVPTGTRYEAHTRADGRYTIRNLRPGGPYDVTTSKAGLRTDTRVSVFAALGTISPVNVEMDTAAVGSKDEVVTIQDPSDNVFADRRSPLATSVAIDRLGIVPTVSRSLQDVTRLVPSANANSFGGANFRYNSFMIDGAATTDAFGFSPSPGGVSGVLPIGTPGAQARTQPISLDAIDEVQASLAPFDVTNGNLTGASINAVTRSGTNQLQGSAYVFGRGASLVGRSVDEARAAMDRKFHDGLAGASIGGPIATNRAFFAVNVERARRSDPVPFAAGSVGARLPLDVANRIRDSLAARAVRDGMSSYDPGTAGAYANEQNADRVFARLDFNLGVGSLLTLRNNYVRANAGNLERGSALFKFASQDYDFRSTSNSSVAELHTERGEFANTLRVAGTVVRDDRQAAGTLFPQIEISDLQYGTIFAGSDREAAVYGARQRNIELADNLVHSGTRHTTTVGAQLSTYHIEYDFYNAYNGRWQYPSLAAFDASRPSRIRATYNLHDNSPTFVQAHPTADFSHARASVYAQDEIALTERFRTTAGVRLEYTRVGAPAVNAAVTATPAFSGYTNDFTSYWLVAPRLSFAWDARADKSALVRGGVGVFQGTVPLAWYAYAFNQSGLQLGNVDLRPTAATPLVTDPERLAQLQTGASEINLVENGFRGTQVMRSALAFDTKLPWGMSGSVEGLHSKVLNDVVFLNAGLKDSTALLAGPDRRPIYLGSGTQQRVNPAFTSVYTLNNTHEGYRWHVTSQLRKQFSQGVDLWGAYTYGVAKDVANGQRNSPQSNWEYNQTVLPNAPRLAFSNYDLRHRLVTSAVYRKPWSATVKTSISLFYTAQSGSPYSYVYNGDLNRDGSSNNDLVYVPASASDVVLVPSARSAGNPDTRTPAQIWADLDAFIRHDPYLRDHRGQYAERNGPRTPWNERLDLRVVQDLPVAEHGVARNLQLTVDVFNFSNMLSRGWGLQYFVPNAANQNVPLMQVRANKAGELPSFSFEKLAKPYQVDDFNSRWQVQAGLRVRF